MDSADHVPSTGACKAPVLTGGGRRCSSPSPDDNRDRCRWKVNGRAVLYDEEEAPGILGVDIDTASLLGAGWHFAFLQDESAAGTRRAAEAAAVLVVAKKQPPDKRTNTKNPVSPVAMAATSCTPGPPLIVLELSSVDYCMSKAAL